jgi:hypothetical protein
MHGKLKTSNPNSKAVVVILCPYWFKGLVFHLMGY